MQYSEGTTSYNRDGVELLEDLKRAGFRRARIGYRHGAPVLVAESLNGCYRIGVQSEGGRYVVISVDDSVEIFTSRVANVRRAEMRGPVENHLVRPMTQADLTELLSTSYLEDHPPIGMKTETNAGDGESEDDGPNSQFWRH